MNRRRVEAAVFRAAELGGQEVVVANKSIGNRQKKRVAPRPALPTPRPRLAPPHPPKRRPKAH